MCQDIRVVVALVALRVSLPGSSPRNPQSRSLRSAFDFDSCAIAVTGEQSLKAPARSRLFSSISIRCNPHTSSRGAAEATTQARAGGPFHSTHPTAPHQPHPPQPIRFAHPSRDSQPTPRTKRPRGCWRTRRCRSVGIAHVGCPHCFARFLIASLDYDSGRVRQRVSARRERRERRAYCRAGGEVWGHRRCECGYGCRQQSLRRRNRHDVTELR